MKRKLRRIIALLMIQVLVTGMIPSGAYAEPWVEAESILNQTDDTMTIDEGMQDEESNDSDSDRQSKDEAVAEKIDNEVKKEEDDEDKDSLVLNDLEEIREDSPEESLEVEAWSDDLLDELEMAEEEAAFYFLDPEDGIVSDVLWGVARTDQSRRLLKGSLLQGTKATEANASEENAYMRNVSLTRTYTGTGPFDDDNKAGNDESANNLVIRTFDKLAYTTSYSIGVYDSLTTVNTGTIYVEAVLPVSSDVATWDLDSMSWLTVDEMSEDTDEKTQTIKGHVYLDSSIAFAPRVGALLWFVQVNGCSNGTLIGEPTFSMQIEGSEAKEAGGRSENTVTVSAKPSYNAFIKYEGQGIYSIGLQLYTLDGDSNQSVSAGKHMKGVELPNGDPIDLTITTNYNQQFLDIKMNDKDDPGENGLLQDIVARYIPYSSSNPAKQGLAKFNTVYNGGKVEFKSDEPGPATFVPAGWGSSDGEWKSVDVRTLEVTVSDYEFDPVMVQEWITHNAEKSSKNQAADYDDSIYTFSSFLIKLNEFSPTVQGSFTVRANLASSQIETGTEQTAGEETLKDNNTAYVKVKDVGNVGYHDGIYFHSNGIQLINESTGDPINLDGGKGRSYLFTREYNGNPPGAYDHTGALKIAPGQQIRYSVEQGYSYSLPEADQVKRDVSFYKIDDDCFQLVDNPDFREYILTTWNGDQYDVVVDQAFYYVLKENGWASEAEMREVRYMGADKNPNAIFEVYTNVEDAIERIESSDYECVGFVLDTELNQNVYKEGYMFELELPVLEVKSSALCDDNNQYIADGNAGRVYQMVKDIWCESQQGKISTRYIGKTASGNQNFCTANNDEWDYTNVVYTYNETQYDNNEVKTVSHSSSASKCNGNGGLMPYGMSVYITGYMPYINKSISQTVGSGKGLQAKETFNLDQGQRRVDYQIVAGLNGALEAKATDTLEIVDTIPVGLNPVAPDGATPEERWGIRYGGTYTNGGDGNGQADGSWSGDNADMLATDEWNEVSPKPDLVTTYQVTETKKANGSTELKWTIVNFPVGAATPVIHYSTIIGTPNSQETDIKNGTQLENTAVVTAVNRRESMTKSVGIVPLKISGATIVKYSDPIQRTENNDKVHFEILFTNFTVAPLQQEETAVDKIVMADVLPYEEDGRGPGANGQPGSSTDPGNYTLQNIGLVPALMGANSEFEIFYNVEDPAELRSKIDNGGLGIGKDFNFDSSDGWESAGTLTFNSDGTINDTSKNAIIANMEGKKITALGYIGLNLPSGSTFRLGFDYDWADAYEAEYMKQNGYFYNSLRYYMGGDVDQQNESDAYSLPIYTVPVKKVWKDIEEDKIPASVDVKISRIAQDDDGANLYYQVDEAGEKTAVTGTTKTDYPVLEDFTLADEQTQTVTLTADDQWYFKWLDLDRKYVYVIEELTQSDDFMATVFKIDDLKNDNTNEYFSYTKDPAMMNGYIIENNGETEVDVPVKKIWNDNGNEAAKRPVSVTFQLYADDVEVEGKTLTLEASPSNASSNEWTGTFKDLPKYNDQKQEIVYTVREQTVNGYTASYSNATLTVTNTYVPTENPEESKVDVPVKKIWQDHNNENLKRPSEITIQLYANSTVVSGKTLVITASASDATPNEWEGVFTDLPELDTQGEKIIYTVRETAVSGYATSYSEDTLTITNTYSPDTPPGPGPTPPGGTPKAARIIISAAKTLNGKVPSGSDFYFDLKDAGGNIIQTKQNADGVITFDVMSFDDEGTYTYTLTERTGTKSNMNYAKTVYTIMVHVTLADDYQAQISYRKDGVDYSGTLLFENTTKPGGSGGGGGGGNPPGSNSPGSSETPVPPIVLPVGLDDQPPTHGSIHGLPKTGDSTKTRRLLGLLGVTLSLAGALTFIRKKRKDDEEYYH